MSISDESRIRKWPEIPQARHHRIPFVMRCATLLLLLPTAPSARVLGRRFVVASAVAVPAAAAADLPATDMQAAVDAVLSSVPVYFVASAIGQPYLTEVDEKSRRFGLAFLGPLDAAPVLAEVRRFDPSATLAVVPLASVYGDLAQTALDAERARDVAPQPRRSTSTDMRLFQLQPLRDEEPNLRSFSMLLGGTLLPGVNLFYEPDLFIGAGPGGSRVRPYAFRLADLNSVWRQGGGDDRGQVSPSLRVISLRTLLNKAAAGTLDAPLLLLPPSETAQLQYRGADAPAAAAASAAPPQPASGVAAAVQI